jgi:hypothetical protein
MAHHDARVAAPRRSKCGGTARARGELRILGSLYRPETFMQRFSRIASVFVIALLVAPSLFAAEDLTGKWSGSFNITVSGMEPRESTVYLVMKHAGKQATGTIGPNEGEQWPIHDGVVTVAGTVPKETTKVVFEVQPGDGGPPLHVELDLVDGHLKGTGKAEQGGISMSAAIDMTRVK